MNSTDKTRVHSHSVGTLRSAALAAVALVMLGASTPSASAAPERTAGRAYASLHRTPLKAQASAKQQYAIEFRSRYALSYGHAFVMYGPLTAKGEFATRTVAGLHPAGDDPRPWMVGHLVPVASETGPSDGDMEDEYMSAKYRITMDREEYERVVAHIKYKQAHSPTWHVIFNNCTGWIGEIAQFMGLKAPPAVGDYPKEYINKMRAMNEGNTRSGALSLAQ